jgi:uncharacterized Zn-binding protein involved in type VI secretion
MDVKIKFLGAWRVNDDTHLCAIPIAPPAPAPHADEKCVLGSMTVMINKKMACRMGDMLIGKGPPSAFAKGEMSVLIGDIPFGLASQSSIDDY